MKKFQIKNQFKLFFSLALFCAVLFSCVISFNTKKFDVGFESQAFEIASNHDDIVKDLIDDTTALETFYDMSEIYPLFAENQTSSNHCWLYSSSKALESSLMIQKKEFVNISETGMAYVAYRNGVKDVINSAGNFETFNMIANNYGVVYERDFGNDKYFDLTEENSDNYSYVLEKTDSEILNTVEAVPLATNKRFYQSSEKEEIIKKYIKKYGGLFVGVEKGIIYKDDISSGKIPYFYSTNQALEVSKVFLNANHAVCLIGWNDTYGFIALNSWGTDFDKFYIPFDYEFAYGTVNGYVVDDEAETVDLIETTAGDFDEVTMYSGELENVFCNKETVSLTYKISNAVDFHSIFVDVTKSGEDVTQRFSIDYNDTLSQVKIEFTDMSDMFLGGEYAINFNGVAGIVKTKSFFVFTGTEISYFTLVKQDYLQTEDSVFLMNNYLSANNTVTYSLTGTDSYILYFESMPFNESLKTGNSMIFDVTEEKALSVANGVEQVEEIDLNLKVYTRSDFYQITIPSLYDYLGKVVSFKITVNSNISQMQACSREFFVNIWVDGSNNTKDAYAIEYVLDGGLNSPNNVSRYSWLVDATVEGEGGLKDYKVTSFKLKEPTKNNQRFMGWYLEPDFKTEVSFVDGSFDSDIVLYARWQEDSNVEFFNISFGVDSVVGYDKSSKTASTNLVYGDTIKFKFEFIPTKELEKYSGVTATYTYFYKGVELEKRQVNKQGETIFKQHGFPDLKVGTFVVKVQAVVVISHNTSVTKTKEIEFKVAQKAITPEFSDLTYTYDAKEHRPTIKVADGDVYAEDAETFEIKFKEISRVVVGTYSFVDIEINNNNYKLAQNQGCNLVINKKEITLAWENVKVVYNSKAQAPTYKIEGLCGTDTTTVQVSEEEMIAAGIYQINVLKESLSNPNYVLSEDADCEFVIEKAPLTVSFTNVVERSENDVQYRKRISYTITGKLYEDEESLNIQISCDGLTSKQSGVYQITATYNNSNYDIIFTSATYTLTGYYYVYYTLPNGEVHIEKVEEGQNPLGINNEIYEISKFQKYKYSEELEYKGEDLYVVVTVESYGWLVAVGSVALVFVLIYLVVARKYRKSGVA